MLPRRRKSRVVVTECVPWEVPALWAVVSHWELPGAAPPCPGSTPAQNAKSKDLRRRVSLPAFLQQLAIHPPCSHPGPQAALANVNSLPRPLETRPDSSEMQMHAL